MYARKLQICKIDRLKWNIWDIPAYTSIFLIGYELVEVKSEVTNFSSRITDMDNLHKV